MDFLNYIELIKSRSTKECFVKGRVCFEVVDYYVSFWSNGDDYLDGLQFLKRDDTSWTWSNPKEFVFKYLNSKLEFVEYSFRSYGEAKLKKPSELKGVNKSFSIDYIPKKARCQVFIKDNDVWIKHIDYLSPSLEVETEDLGTGLNTLSQKYLSKSRKNKFSYEDAWGDIILRNEAWICIKNLISQKDITQPLDIVNEIISQQEKKSTLNIKEFSLFDSDMSRFYEKLVDELLKFSM